MTSESVAALRRRLREQIDANRPRFARYVLRSARPPRDRRHDESGLCTVCGASSGFVFSSWVLPREMVAELADPATVHAYRQRESLFCRRCGSNLRVRRLAEVLLEEFGSRLPSLAEMIGDPDFAARRIAEVNAIGSGGSMHAVLERHPRLAYSEYRDGHVSGEVVNGVRHEDMTALSYEDASFDLLLTSDTLEHVPEPQRAFGEARRVLRPGGRLVLTVPMLPLRDESVTRARIDANGTVELLVPPQLHGYGSGPFRYVRRREDAYLVFTDFGRDIVDQLEDVGFAARLAMGRAAGRRGEAECVVVGTVPRQESD